MHGVGPGSTLGGRYALARRLSEHPRYERWLAHDQTLQRNVVLVCFPDRGTAAEAALDAARRAAGIDEPRLVRVLDVGRDGETAFVVEEPLIRARDLPQLLEDGPLAAEEARRLVGEAATALERARVRGLHHGALGPRSLLRLDDGGVKVRGLAVEAALLGLDEVDGASASRDDSVALVALAYAALTGHWPLTGPATGTDPGLPAAPAVVGGVPTPSEITAGVPADLDTIARLTLSNDQGPLTPGDLARQIAPWASTAHAASYARPTPPSTAEPTQPVRPEAPRTTAAPGTPADLEDPPPSTADAAPDDAPDDAADDAGAATTAVAAVGAAARVAKGRPTRPRGRTVLGMRLGGGDAPTVPDPAAPTPAPVPAQPEVAGPTGTTDPLDLAALAGGTRPPSPREPLEEDGPGAAPAGDGGPLRITHQMRLSETLEDSDDELEPPLPRIGRIGGHSLGGRGAPPSSDHATTALAAIAALVVVAAALGIFGVSRIGRSSTPTAAPTTSAAVAPTPTAATPTGPATTTSATTAPAVALTDVGIVQAQAWDPEGDNQEGNASTPRSFDGDPATMWRSQAYRSAAFGGFPKSGIGLILDLGQQTSVKQVQVDLVGGSDLTAYVANRESLDGATSIGTSSGVDGTVTFTAPAAGSTGQLVILWFTKLGPDGSGSFRAQVSEVRVRG